MSRATRSLLAALLPAACALRAELPRPAPTHACARAAARVARPPALADAQVENLIEQASAACDQVMGRLSDGVEPPKALATLKEAMYAANADAITAGIYSLVVEQRLEYNVDDAGKMVAGTTQWSEDSEEAQQKMRYVYSYGITMFKRGMIGEARAHRSHARAPTARQIPRPIIPVRRELRMIPRCAGR